MKKIIIALLLTPIIIYAQNEDFNIEIEYDYILNFTVAPYTVNSKLKFNNVASVYEIDHLNIFETNNKTNIDEENVQFSIKSKENEFVYKNLITNQIYYSETMSMKRFDIKSDLSKIMNWSLSSDSKKILGYNCQKAITKYGGRSYIAYFTNEIPSQNGPWRFHGLPGVILEIVSTDGVFKIEATSVNIINSNIKIINPFNNRNTVSWHKFLTIYRKKYDDVIRNSMTEYGPSQILPKKGIVEYISN